MMMKLILLSAILTLSTSVSASTQHTRCFNHFIKQHQCVSNSASNKTRCKVPPHTTDPAPMIALKAKKIKRDSHHLERRYDTTNPSFYVASPKKDSEGICGDYNTTTDLGVCLWSGLPAQKGKPLTSKDAGWLNEKKKSNCHKKVYVMRKHQPETVVYAKVIDGCSFGATTDEVGCFQIGVTLAVFKALNSTDAENQAGTISDLTWDFDGSSPQQSPV